MISTTHDSQNAAMHKHKSLSPDDAHMPHLTSNSNPPFLSTLHNLMTPSSQPGKPYLPPPIARQVAASSSGSWYPSAGQYGYSATNFLNPNLPTRHSFPTQHHSLPHHGTTAPPPPPNCIYAERYSPSHSSSWGQHQSSGAPAANYPQQLISPIRHPNHHALPIPHPQFPARGHLRFSSNPTTFNSNTSDPVTSSNDTLVDDSIRDFAGHNSKPIEVKQELSSTTRNNSNEHLFTTSINSNNNNNNPTNNNHNTNDNASQSKHSYSDEVSNAGSHNLNSGSVSPSRPAPTGPPRRYRRRRGRGGSTNSDPERLTPLPEDRAARRRILNKESAQRMRLRREEEARALLEENETFKVKCIQMEAELEFFERKKVEWETERKQMLDRIHELEKKSSW